MRIDVLTKEYPPEIYGGAGVHVAELVRALRQRPDLATHVHAFGAPRDEELTSSYADHAELASANGALRTLGVDLSIVDGCAGTDLVHSHTWYANFAGHLASLLYGVPHVVSAHSLEPLRPWKAEQLGGGYAVSSWIEKTSFEAASAVIAVSAAMRDDVLASYPSIDPARVHVVHNGIDTESWAPSADPDRVRSHGVDPDRPSVVFVGRITRQKGLPLFLRAVAQLPPEVQIVLCAGAPDTPEIEAEVVGRRHVHNAAGADEVLGLFDLVAHLGLVPAAGALGRLTGRLPSPRQHAHAEARTGCGDQARPVRHPQRVRGPRGSCGPRSRSHIRSSCPSRRGSR